MPAIMCRTIQETTLNIIPLSLCFAVEKVRSKECSAERKSSLLISLQWETSHLDPTPYYNNIQ